MIDLNDISFTLPVQIVTHDIPARCNSATPLKTANVRRIQTPLSTVSPQCLHASLDALATELNDSDSGRVGFICKSLSAIADEIERLPFAVNASELSLLLAKITQLFAAAEGKENCEHTIAKKVRKIQTPQLDLRSFRTKTPLCPRDIQRAEDEPTPRRFLFP
ncbi:Hypothetical protein, putative [Bodo saltans]|uniref:Uncharacterized protein n=1 Tax=Bodo saltans TaxID=75058 RepID=A0A0S4JPY0_BODSA|nr:Hypothetical protein, putative [Bodo saltans]|eukprot:CUG92236.1 Hypothetical protein, putative [Bodo saltans]